MLRTFARIYVFFAEILSREHSQSAMHCKDPLLRFLAEIPCIDPLLRSFSESLMRYFAEILCINDLNGSFA